jgi:hypothetical protein
MICNTGMLVAELIMALIGIQLDTIYYQLLLASHYTWSLFAAFMMYCVAMQYFGGAKMIVGKLAGTCKDSG